MRSTTQDQRIKAAYKESIARNIVVYGEQTIPTALKYGVRIEYADRAAKGYDMRNRASAKKAGTAFETAVADYLAAYLEKPIERRARMGAKDRGDIAGVTTYYNKPVVVECKCEQRVKVGTYLKEAEIEKNHDEAYASFVVFKRNGIGMGKNSPMGRQCVFMKKSDLFTLANCNRWNNQSIIHGIDGMSVKIDKLNISRKYDIEGALSVIESSNCKQDAHVVLHQAQDGDYFVVTTLENVAKMLGYKPK